MSKEACVVVLDVGESMGKLQKNSGMTGLDKAKHAFRLMVQQKLLFGAKQDVFGVVLFNTNKTNNDCNEKYGGYENIDQYFELQTPGLELLECIDSVNVQKGNGDALDALLVAAQNIFNFCGKKKYSKRIFMITDCDKRINDIEQIHQIAGSFIEQQIKFFCIGIGFGEEKEDDDDNEDDDEDDDDDDNNKDFNNICIVGGDSNRSESVVRNEKILRHFGHLVSGNIYTSTSAIKMMSELRSKSVLLRPTYSGIFSITPSINISVKIYCRCREQTLPSLKKESMIGNEGKKVLMDRLYRNKHRKEDDEEVEEDERVKSYLYGKERIPFNENDEERLNYKSGLKHFECLGFVSSDKIPRHQFMSSSSILTAEANNDTSSLCLSSFIRACHEKSCYCLARLVSRKNAAPKYVVLQPRIKTSKDEFIINQLPFYEDIRKFPFASFNIKKNYVPNKQQISACKNLIKSLNLMDAAVDEDGDVMEALKPQNTFNPILQRFYQNLQNRALDPQNEIQDLDGIILKYLEPDPILFNNENTKKCMQNFENLFPTKIIQKKQIKKERKHWNDISDELDNLFGGDNDNKKEKKEDGEDEDDEDEDIDLNALNVDEITEIGTKTPISDFDYLLKERKTADWFKKLHNDFWIKIFKLIDESYQNLNYDKALKCILHLKKAAIKDEEPLIFNNELKKFKIKYQNKKKPSIWKFLCDQREKEKNNEITLICNHDFIDDIPEGLNISKNESDEFFTQKIEENIVEKIEVDSESDNDLDDLV